MKNDLIRKSVSWFSICFNPIYTIKIVRMHIEDPHSERLLYIYIYIVTEGSYYMVGVVGCWLPTGRLVIAADQHDFSKMPQKVPPSFTPGKLVLKQLLELGPGYAHSLYHTSSFDISSQ